MVLVFASKEHHVRALLAKTTGASVSICNVGSVRMGVRRMVDNRTSDRRVDLSKAKSYVIAANYHSNPNYSPYCGRCPGLDRMKLVEPYLWNHFCGAIHDERQVLL